MIFIFIIIALAIALVLTYTSKAHLKTVPVNQVDLVDHKKQEEHNERFQPPKQTKRVRFSPIVTYGNAGGDKPDRFNPDLRDCV